MGAQQSRDEQLPDLQATREPYPGFDLGLPYDPNTEAGFWQPSSSSSSRFDSFQSRLQLGEQKLSSSEVPMCGVGLQLGQDSSGAIIIQRVVSPEIRHGLQALT